MAIFRKPLFPPLFRRLLKWTALTVVTAVVIFVAYVAYHLLTADRNWALAKERVAALAAEAEARDGTRSVLRGETFTGKAWDEYALALKAVEKLDAAKPREVLVSFTRLDGQQNIDRHQVEELLSGNPQVLEHMRRGVQRNNGQYPYQWETAKDDSTPGMNKPLLAGYMALAQARLWTEAGRPQDAMDLLMDNCVFAHDLAFNGGFVGHAAATILYDLSLDEVRKIVQSGKLNHESLSRLSTNLESLERDFPSLGPVMLNKALFDGNILLQVESENEKDLGIASLKPLIPQVLSRIWYSGAFLTVEATARKLQDIERKPFNKAQAEVESAKADFQGSWNPITRAMSSLPNAIGREDRYRRETLTFIRLLRTATEFISSGQAPSFDDPFGAKLPQSREGGRLRFWSVGPDGKNNDGKGPSTWSVGTFPEGQDIVLEIEARPSHQ